MSAFVGDRLSEIIHYYHLTMNSFSKKLGLTSNSVITRAVRENERGISQELMQKILHTFPEIDALWLVTGKGTMIKANTPPTRCDACEAKEKLLAERERTIERLEKAIDLSQQTIEHLLDNSSVDTKVTKHKD